MLILYILTFWSIFRMTMVLIFELQQKTKSMLSKTVNIASIFLFTI